jgi:hypothetical protein
MTPSQAARSWSSLPAEGSGASMGCLPWAIAVAPLVRGQVLCAAAQSGSLSPVRVGGTFTSSGGSCLQEASDFGLLG